MASVAELLENERREVGERAVLPTGRVAIVMVVPDATTTTSISRSIPG
jgi:hypothetical protein